jgi:predicted ATPase
VRRSLALHIGGSTQQPPHSFRIRRSIRSQKCCLDPASAVPLIAPLLDLPLTPQYPSSSLPADQQRRRLLAYLVEWILGTARQRPLLIALEDLHWADPSMLDFLQLLVEQGSAEPLFLLCTARPEFHRVWPLGGHHVQLTLNRLETRDVRAMVTQIGAQRVLTDEIISAVLDRTGGVPLFIEELTRAVLERGKAKVAERAIPATLHESLMARLDKLGPARETLQIGAVLGSEFSYELLAAVHQLEDSELQRRLRKLTDAELLYGIAPEASYQFKHALIRDAAYEALLKSRSKELHFKVARAMDEHFANLKDMHPEALAIHWEAAGENERALAEWTRAGKLAHSQSAFREVLDNYRRALALIEKLPEASVRDSRELELRMASLGVLFATKGPSAKETIEVNERAASLTEKTPSLTQVFESLYVRCQVVLTAGDRKSASALADHAFAVALRLNLPIFLASAYLLKILVCSSLSDLTGADKCFTTGLETFDSQFFKNGPFGRVTPIVAFGARALAPGYLAAPMLPVTESAV